jgi:adenylate cyclase
VPKGELDWKAILEGRNENYRRQRAVFRRLPRSPRCKMCAAPFEGPAAPFMRLLGRGRWANNPNYCGICFRWIRGHRGGAEVEISLMFADVRGSTALGERMAPAEFSALLSRFYDLATRTVIERDGIVDKFVGDEIMALFAPPFAGSAHPLRAIEAARSLVEQAAGPDGGGEPIPVGAGVHTGIAFVGAVGGEGGLVEFTALGDAVNTTARLASAAGPGEVLVTRAAADAAGLASDGFEERHLELRGRTEPVDVVVLRPRPEASST